MSDKILVEFNRKKIIDWCKKNCDFATRCFAIKEKNKENDYALIRCFTDDYIDFKIKEQNNGNSNNSSC